MFVDVVAVIGENEGDLGKINWTLKQFRLDELTDYYKNPRSLSEKEFKQLKTSLDKFGMIDKPIVNADAGNTIIGGHQRKHVLEAGGAKEVECWIPDRELSGKEVEELNIRLNKNTGSWDVDIIANEWEVSDLIDWGFMPYELGIAGDPINPEDEWKGMPEFESKDIMGAAVVCLVRFVDEKDISEFERLLGWKLSHKGEKYSTWYPKQNFDQLGKGLSFIDES